MRVPAARARYADERASTMIALSALPMVILQAMIFCRLFYDYFHLLRTPLRYAAYFHAVIDDAAAA